MKDMSILRPTAALLIILMHSAVADPDMTQKVWTDPDTALREDSDFRIQGEYEGEGVGAQVIALGGGKFDACLLQGGLPGAGGKRGIKHSLLHGQRRGDKIDFVNANQLPIVSIQGATMSLLAVSGIPSKLTRIERTSPTLGAEPPEGAVILFDGTSADAWENGKMENGHLLATGATSKRRFRDYTLHLEFRTPYMPAARGQKRGNSGIYHSGRWETQILDSFGLEGNDNECGGIYSISKPLLNMCLPPLAWQTYDVEFTAAKFDAVGKRTAWPRITVKLNGVVVHENLELSKDLTTAAPIKSPLESPDGPVFLQNHNDPVVFRNIWIVPAP